MATSRVLEPNGCDPILVSSVVLLRLVFVGGTAEDGAGERGENTERLEGSWVLRQFSCGDPYP